MFMPLSRDAYFIELVYSVLASQESELKFRIDHLRINLCLPYILKLYQIAMEAISSPNKEPNTNTSKNRKPVEKHQQRTVEEQPDVSTSKDANSLKVRAEIKLPEIVLFAEPEKYDSKILLMKAEIGLEFESRSGDVLLKIDLNDLGIRLGEYNNAQKHGIPFLSPCVLTMVMKQKNGKAFSS